jgi:hypothetical protein
LTAGNGSRPGTQAIRRAIAKAPLPDEEAKLAKLIGESVALHLGQLLGQLVPQVLQAAQQIVQHTECLFCVLAARKLVAAYQVAVANAAAAAEPVPDLPPQPQVARAVTWVNVVEQIMTPAGPQAIVTTVPACWEHVPVPGDAPRPTGLVGVDGRPIVRT